MILLLPIPLATNIAWLAFATLSWIILSFPALLFANLITTCLRWSTIFNLLFPNLPGISANWCLPQVITTLYSLLNSNSHFLPVVVGDLQQVIQTGFVQSAYSYIVCKSWPVTFLSLVIYICLVEGHRQWRFLMNASLWYKPGPWLSRYKSSTLKILVAVLYYFPYFLHSQCVQVI